MEEIHRSPFFPSLRDSDTELCRFIWSKTEQAIKYNQAANDLGRFDAYLMLNGYDSLLSPLLSLAVLLSHIVKSHNINNISFN